MSARNSTDRARHALLIYFALALGLVVLTLVLDRLEAFFGPALLVPYLVLIALAARWGGLGAAVFTSLATIPLVDFFLLGPQGQLDLSARQSIQLSLVLLAGLLLGWLMDGLRLARERAEAAALAERTALEERDALLSIIAHDLRSPLTATRARVQLADLALRRESPDREAALRSLEAALPQVDRVSRLLDDLVTAARSDGGKLAVELVPLDLEPLVGRIADRWRSDSSSHPIELDLSGPLPVLGDADRLEQVLDNLIGNAIKYSPAGRPIRVSAGSEGGEARLAVSDQGEGIPPDEQAQIFERFYRRPEHRAGSQQGAGLGLFITRELVVAHGGWIQVESEPSRGTTFKVGLPLQAVAQPGGATSVEAAEQRAPPA